MVNRDNESTDELKAREFLEKGLSLKVTRVQEGDEKSADYLVDGDTPGYIVEVKSRVDGKDYQRGLESGQVAMAERLLGYDRWGADNARNALKQFGALDPNHQRLWILWFAIKCDAGADAMFNQAIGTLFGVKQIAYFDEASQSAHARDCLYAVHGVFERWPAIDGAFVTLGSRISFCTNEFSRRAQALEASIIYRSIAEMGGPNTATKLETERGFYSIRDRTVDRKNEQAVCVHLENKYGLKNVHVLDMEAFMATMRTPSPSKTPR